MTFEDRIRAAMHAHDDEAPVAAGLPARPQVSRGGRYTWLPIAAAAAVVLAVVALVVTLGGGRNRDVASSSVPSKTASATRPLTCPAQYVRTPGGIWVPAQPHGVDGSSRLVPAATPTHVVVCAYLGRAGLTGRQELTGDLRRVTDTLTLLPKDLNSSRPCASYSALTDGDFYLIGLTYPSGTMWVSAPGQHCDGAGNGAFSTPTNLRARADAAYRAGRWPATPTGAPGSGRRGQESAMVPAGATTLQIVVQPTGSTRATQRRVDHGFEPLIEALNRLPTRISTGDCRGRPTGDAYELHFGYPSGPEAVVNVVPFCRPAIDNRSVTAADATTIVPLIAQLLHA